MPVKPLNVSLRLRTERLSLSIVDRIYRYVYIIYIYTHTHEFGHWIHFLYCKLLNVCFFSTINRVACSIICSTSANRGQECCLAHCQCHRWMFFTLFWVQESPLWYDGCMMTDSIYTGPIYHTAVPIGQTLVPQILQPLQVASNITSGVGTPGQPIYITSSVCMIVQIDQTFSCPNPHEFLINVCSNNTISVEWSTCVLGYSFRLFPYRTQLVQLWGRRLGSSWMVKPIWLLVSLCSLVCTKLITLYLFFVFI